MDVTFVPTLAAQHELLEAPAGPDRFARYLALMQGDTGDVDLPLMAFNPMAKPHARDCLAALIAARADAAGATAADAAAARLDGTPGAVKVTIVLVDDVAGGWTDRVLTDAEHRFQTGAIVKRGWATAFAWASEAPDAARLGGRVAAAIHGHVTVSANGEPKTLRAAMAQEGAALAFGGATEPTLTDAEAGVARAAFAGRLDEPHYPTVVAGMYGDEAARHAGYAPLGVAANAGFALGLAAARRPQPT